MTKKWKIKQKAPQDFFNQFPEINNIILQLLYNRGLTEQDEIDQFLSPSYDDQIYNPFLFKDMKRASDRILEAVSRNEKIMIYGDYDADGVCASTVIFQTLKELGTEPVVYIPFREKEGYGLNQKVAEKIIDQNYDLVITVDCGIANKKEIKIISQAGIDVVVTDHHQEPAELPTAYAILNPQVKDSGYPFKGLCGAGVAWKLVQGIVGRQDFYNLNKKLPVGWEKWLLDIVALATIGDMMPLLDENRVIVERGLLVMSKTRRLGLKKLMAVSSRNYDNGIDTQYVGWRLVPRINAAGRVNHASASFYLLNSENEEEAEKLAQDLEKENSQRQKMTEVMMAEAFEQISEPENKNLLWAIKDDWPIGIIGLVAGKLTDAFYRPAVLLAKKNKNIYVGSCRSIEEFDITKALAQCKDLLIRYGGHSQAGGFSVTSDNLNKFKTKLEKIADNELKEVDLTPSLSVEQEIELKDVNWDLWQEIEKFQPFGEDNESPLLVINNLQVEQIQTVGKEGKHLKLQVSQKGSTNSHKLIGFSFGDWCAKINNGDKIDVVFELGVNEWNGNRELQLKIMDLKLSDI